MRFCFIHKERGNFSLYRLCKTMNVSQSGYHAWRSRPASKRQRNDLVLFAHIRSEFATSKQSYGRPRMTRELQEKGLIVSHYKVGKLMKENNIRPVRTRKYRHYPKCVPPGGYAPNLLDQDFSAEAPNQKWSVDITQIMTAEGWLYLAVVLDLFSRRIVGWAVNKHMKTGLPLLALNKAIALRRPRPGLIHHSDRGSQYCSNDYQCRLKETKMHISMSGKGVCYDNAHVETFFKSLKAEMAWRTKFETRAQADIAIRKYINEFYNPKRRHSTLDYISPIQYEREAA